MNQHVGKARSELGYERHLQHKGFANRRRSLRPFKKALSRAERRYTRSAVQGEVWEHINAPVEPVPLRDPTPAGLPNDPYSLVYLLDQGLGLQRKDPTMDDLDSIWVNDYSYLGRRVITVDDWWTSTWWDVEFIDVEYARFLLNLCGK